MNWFKKLFGVGDKEELDYNGLPKVSCDIPMPKVRPPKAGKDISEPIISFVKCVQENPKRFKVVYDYEYNDMGFSYNTSQPIVKEIADHYYFIFKDLQTKESWSLYGGFRAPVLTRVNDYEGKHTSNPEWLTQDERVYLINSIKTIFESREGRKERVVELRKERRVRAERNRLKEIYCDGN